jgi:hypothetical protein
MRPQNASSRSNKAEPAHTKESERHGVRNPQVLENRLETLLARGFNTIGDFLKTDKGEVGGANPHAGPLFWVLHADAEESNWDHIQR